MKVYLFSRGKCELYDQGFNQEVHQAQKAKDTMDTKKGLETSTRYDASNTMHSCFALSRNELHLVFPKVLFRIQLGRISTSIIGCGTCQEFHSRNANHDVI